MRGCFALVAGFLSLSRHAVETRTHNVRALLARRTGNVLCLRRTCEPPEYLSFTKWGPYNVDASACPSSAMSNRGTRAPPRKSLERGSTFDSFFYIVGQLTTRPTELLGSFFLFVTSPSSSPRLPRGQTLWRFSASWIDFSKLDLKNFEASFAGDGKTLV